MWKFIKSSSESSNWLYGHSREVCFIGRSNVGKSSLINALTKAKLARTSNTPGRTQLINFFQEDDKTFVDLPGYGWARMSKTDKERMNRMVLEYFSERKELIHTFVLLDAKVGPTSDDILLIEYLKSKNMEFKLVITKVDKVNQSQLHNTILSVLKLSSEYIVVSSLKNKNILQLQKLINNLFNG